MSRRAVVLMNLGGPDSPAAIRPFLYNLFSDPAIIGLPAPLRLPLAALIAARRSKTAEDIYAHLGGASPLLANTEAQARALEAELGDDHRCFIAMRHWHPLTEEAVAQVKAWRQLLSRAALAADAGQRQAVLLSAILASRKGQADLSAVLETRIASPGFRSVMRDVLMASICRCRSSTTVEPVVDLPAVL